MNKPPQSPTDPIRPNPRANKIRSAPKKKEPKKVHIDWKGYFLEFCKTHGEPVEYKGVLLFRDGWRYAMDYVGPEFKPPTEHNELDRLVATYWTIRLRRCKETLNKVWTERDRINLLKEGHSLPLMQITVVGVGAERKKISAPLDTRRIEDTIRWLQADIVECEKMISELKTYYTPDVPRNSDLAFTGEKTDDKAT